MSHITSSAANDTTNAELLAAAYAAQLAVDLALAELRSFVNRLEERGLLFEFHVGVEADRAQREYDAAPFDPDGNPC